MLHPFMCDSENFIDGLWEINDLLPFLFPFLLKVKVDESLSLDHVTRDRVKVAHGRRPPTRSHLKEVGTSHGDRATSPAGTSCTPAHCSFQLRANPQENPGADSPEKAQEGNGFPWDTRRPHLLTNLQVNP